MNSKHKLITLTALMQSAGLALAAPDFSVSINNTLAVGLSDDGHAATAIGGHDPNEDFTVQGIEVGLSTRVNEYLEGFFNVNVFVDTEDEFQAESEEAFLKLKNLPLGTEIRGGRYLNRIGTENNVHLHGWDYVSSSFSTALLLGEEGLTTDGFELSHVAEYSGGDFIISASFGEAVVEDHEEEEEEEEEDESQELSFFASDLFTIRAQLRHYTSDFHQHRIGASFAAGENGFDRDSQIFEFDYTYTWRENGLEAGGREISAGIDYYFRNTEWQDEDDSSIAGDSDQNAIAVNAAYAWNEYWKLGARYEYLEGASSEVFNIDRRQRASLALTYQRQLDEDWATQLRLQYNNDRVADERSNSAYLQVGFSYGGNEVR